MNIKQTNVDNRPPLLTIQSIQDGKFFHITEECHGTSDQLYLKTGATSFVCFGKCNPEVRIDNGSCCRKDACAVIVPIENVLIEFSL
tara:strand:- start:2425 stop:2685 length:261 start_codon:yes stop_codon:yes gene_type:complete